jgi:hypothetical protein
MRTFAQQCVVLASIVTLTGCTHVVVERIKPDTDASAVRGQRFSLPRPYIQVTPQADGSVVAEVVYMPDPDHTYAIHSYSIFATNALEVITENSGIIKSVNWTADSSAVVAGAITSTGTVTGTLLQAEQKQKQEAQAQENSASKAVADARLALAQAEANLALALASGTAADILRARIAVSDATLKLQALEAALNRIRSAADNPNEGKFFGPMLFAINDELRADAPGTKSIRSVGLTAVKQTPAATETGWDPIQPSYPVTRPQAPKPPSVKLYPDGVVSIRPDKDGNVRLLLQATYPLVSLVKAKLRFRKTDGTELALRGVPPGTYQLALFWRTKPPADAADADGQKVVDIVVSQ